MMAILLFAINRYRMSAIASTYRPFPADVPVRQQYSLFVRLDALCTRVIHEKRTDWTVHHETRYCGGIPLSELSTHTRVGLACTKACLFTPCDAIVYSNKYMQPKLDSS